MFMKKSAKTFLLAVVLVILSGFTGKFAFASTVEIGEVRSLGTKVTVPVRILDTTYLTSGQMNITVAPGSKGVKLESFEKGPLFKGAPFGTISSIEGNRLKIDFHGDSQSLLKKPVVIGYITYSLDSSFVEGEKVSLQVSNVVASSKPGIDLTFDTLDGLIERKMPIGDVTGTNSVDASGAIRILQHIQGNPITNEEERLSADVDGDGRLTQNDVQQILDYSTGKRSSFLAIKAKELDPAVLKSEFNEQVEALHGREPYQFAGKGVLPSGLKVNPVTGGIQGIPTRAGSYKFTVEVTDAIGNKETREFSLEVIDSNIVAYDKLLPINVQQNMVPTLPSEVTVTYKDKSKGNEKVTWGSVDTSTLGVTVVKGKLGTSGFTVSVEIQVVANNYLNDVKINYVAFLNLHTIIINVSPDVYRATVNDTIMLFEGQNEFSIGSTSFVNGSNVDIRLYDKFGNLLETKQQRLNAN